MAEREETGVSTVETTEAATPEDGSPAIEPRSSPAGEAGAGVADHDGETAVGDFDHDAVEGEEEEGEGGDGEKLDEDSLVLSEYACPNCGEAMLTLPEFPLIGCMFCCSSFEAVEPELALLWAPDAVVPFAVDKGLFFETVLRWMADGELTPDDIFRQVYLDLAEELYLPFYLFEGRYRADYAAALGTEQVVEGSREPTISWQPTSGTLDGRFAALQYAGVGNALPPDIVEFLETMPIDAAMLVPFEEFTIEGSVFRPFDLDVDRLYEEKTVKGLRKMIEEQVVDKLGSPHVDDLRVTPTIEKIAKSVYLPVWLLSYQYKEETYYVAVDGILSRKKPKTPKTTKPRIHGTKPSDAYREMLFDTLYLPFKLWTGVATGVAFLLLFLLDLSGWWQFIIVLGYIALVMGLYRRTENRRSAILAESREKRASLLRHLKQKCVNILTSTWRAEWISSMAESVEARRAAARAPDSGTVDDEADEEPGSEAART